MSRICKSCNTGISSSDYNATDETCSACLLDNITSSETQQKLELAERIIELLVGEGSDAEKATRLAIEYQRIYL